MYMSTATPRELLRINGSLPIELQESLIDAHEKLDGVISISANISEASAQYPAEDFLTSIVDDINALVKNLRGQNRNDLAEISLRLQEIAAQEFNNSEYGRDELRKAQKALST